MTIRPDGFTNFDDLSPDQKAQARRICGRVSILTEADAPFFAYRITKGSQGVPAGIVSESRKDRRLATNVEDRLKRRASQ